jgi:hypothetical protein
MHVRKLIVLPALFVAAQSVRAQESPAPSQQDAEKAALIQMKSDLRNLVTAQEAYFADNSAYASSMDGLKFRPSQNVSIRLTATQNNAWAAETRSSLLPNVACVIWINLKEPDRPKVGGVLLPQGEGEPACGLIEKR